MRRKRDGEQRSPAGLEPGMLGFMVCAFKLLGPAGSPQVDKPQVLLSIFPEELEKHI